MSMSQTHIDTFDPYGNKSNFQGAASSFLETNTIVAKLAFLLLVIFIFIILLRVGTSLLSYFFSFSTNPILIKGMIDAEKLVVVAQNPNTPGAMPILRSKNERDGLEFTWSIWLWVKNPPLSSSASAKPNQYKHVFSKGNDNISSDGLVTPNNAPGLYIGPNYRDLVVIMNTFDNPKEEIVIGDLPIEKWVNVIIRCDQHKLDVFINGMLTRRHIMKGVPKQNYDNVYVALNGGFSGRISLLQYFAYDIGTTEIQTIVDNGPDLTEIDPDLTKTKPYYLSFRWFFPEQSSEVNF
jgi:hypothetical protein